MAYSAITSGQIEAGDPFTQELATKIKDNFDNHETRIAAVEAASQTYPPIKFIVRGAASLYGAVTGMEYLRIFNDITLTAGRIFVVVAGSAGTAEVDVQYKRGGAAFATIFTTRPSAGYGSGNYFTTTNGVLSVTDIQAGDILRLDLVSAQTDCEEFHVYLPYNPA